MTDKPGIELLLFATDPQIVAAATDAGVDGFIVDWERRGKADRQSGADTEINEDTVDDLHVVRQATNGTVLCRLNGFGAWTPGEVDTAIDAGADELLLPMVRHPTEVDRTLALIDGRARLGILIETTDAVACADELASRPVRRIYVGLNDLAIDRGSQHLFEALADGTADTVALACAAARMPFGVAGLTRPEAGWPIPCRLLTGELARLGAGFTFLRRSFHADVTPDQYAVEIPRIKGAVAAARTRSPDEVAADRSEFSSAVLVPVSA